MSSINQNDIRRYRMRSTGIVYRVLGERHDEMDFAPVCGGVAMEVKRADVEEKFARCDMIHPRSPTCKQCGGEKFTLYGGVTVCVYCASQPSSTATHEPVASDADRFVRHLEWASETVRAWPEWKQDVAARSLGGATVAASADTVSKFIAKGDGFEAAERAIDALGELRDGWADVDSIAPSAASIATAKLVARALVGFGCEFEVDGDVDGGVALTMFGRRCRALFVISSRPYVSMVLTDESKNAPQSFRVDPLDPAKEIVRAMEFIGMAP